MHCNVMNYNEILFLIIIVMQRNCTKHFPGGVHYPDAIFLMAIIWGYISVVNIILRGNSLSASCLRANYLGDNFRASNFRGAIIRGAIILGVYCPGANYPEGNCPGGNCPVPLFVSWTFINHFLKHKVASNFCRVLKTSVKELISVKLETYSL